MAGKIELKTSEVIVLHTLMALLVSIKELADGATTKQDGSVTVDPAQFQLVSGVLAELDKLPGLPEYDLDLAGKVELSIARLLFSR